MGHAVDEWFYISPDGMTPKKRYAAQGTNREFHDENRKPVHKWYAPLHQAHEDEAVNNRQHGEKWDHEGSLQMAAECSQKQGTIANAPQAKATQASLM